MSPNLAESLHTVQQEIAQACNKAGRDPSDVMLLAISKLQPVESILEVAAAGQCCFGENYVQEALAKRDELEKRRVKPVQWHFTGHIQSRKAAEVAGAFELIHTLDSKKIADHLERKLAASQLIQRILLEVNIGEEPQKAGVYPEQTGDLLDYVSRQCPHLKLDGLMCLPPVYDSGEGARPYFSRLRQLRDELEKTRGLQLPELSMGMSGDFHVAIEEGATIVRIGTRVFGPRPVKDPKFSLE